jgi:GNAT superfamily N-acetyltransferase
MIAIKECDFGNTAHRNAIILLMNDYMSDNMGGNLPPYTSALEEKLLRGLESHPSKLILLAEEKGHYIGLANCFINFGTFAAQPFINIHDLVVLSGHRGKKTGRLLMETIYLKARELNCSKITLEVREDNLPAQKLYSGLGYRAGIPPMHFWTKYL